MKILPVTEKCFEYQGYPCVVLFMPMGHRCGYVGVPKTHRYYEFGYDEVAIDCHYGLNYARNYLETQDGSELWWFGFSCDHYGDRPDIEAIRKYYPGIPRLYERAMQVCFPEDIVRDTDFAVTQCVLIAEQLKAMEEQHEV